ncbi:hypothetical protein OKW23_000877 [Bacilli bacterium PM5-9]|nr:hypothetical protein [Bacilli bacterium PM5-9]
MKKNLTIMIALLICLTMSVSNENKIEAKTTKKCSTTKNTQKCYYYTTGYKSYSKRIYTKYYKNGKKQYRDYIYKNKNGIRTLTKQYRYNKKGQLKSNKYGNATRRFYYYYNNNKISKRITWNYNKKGKLTKKKVLTKPYLKNKPKTYGDKIAKSAKSMVGKVTAQCNELADKAVIKAGWKGETVEITAGNTGHTYKAPVFEPNEYAYTKLFALKNSGYYKYFNGEIKNGNMKASQLESVSSSKALVKKLKAGDIVIYNDNWTYHVSVYIGGGKAVHGGMPNKKGEYVNVEIAPVELGGDYKITAFYRIYK